MKLRVLISEAMVMVVVMIVVMMEMRGIPDDMGIICEAQSAYFRDHVDVDDDDVGYDDDDDGYDGGEWLGKPLKKMWNFQQPEGGGSDLFSTLFQNMREMA